MAYRRVTKPHCLLTGDDLTRAMIAIGMNLVGSAAPEPNIEDTLIAASIEGMERDDLRVLDLLVTWLEVHHPWINADRLNRALRVDDTPRVRAFWAAAGNWLRKDQRLKRLAELFTDGRVDLLSPGTDLLIQRDGEDRRLKDGPLRVPAGVLRGRKSDVLSPSDLARRHVCYRYRVLMGPSYRADMWAGLELNSSQSAADLARSTYGSFATAWQVKQDWDLLKAS